MELLAFIVFSKMIISSPEELIGKTPLFKVKKPKLTKGASVFLKLESFNLTGSMKDRSAINMIISAI